jgi:hypothetical protein
MTQTVKSFLPNTTVSSSFRGEMNAPSLLVYWLTSQGATDTYCTVASLSKVLSLAQGWALDQDY